MSASLNTARAQLTAGNHDGARRTAKQVLEDEPKNIDAWMVLIEIERNAGNNKKALELIEQALALRPDHIGLRQDELLTFIILGKKRRARLGVERFRKDFPQVVRGLEELRVLYEAKFGSDRRALRMFEGVGSSGDEYLEGMLRTRAGDLFAGQRLLYAALKRDPCNYDINAGLAFNQMALSKPSSTRRHAGRALEEKPFDRQMRWMKVLTWFMYFPPVYFLHLLMTAFCLARSRVPLVVILLIVVPFFGYITWPISWFEIQVEALGVPYFKWFSNAYSIGYILAIAVITTPLAKWFLKSKRAVRLKKY